MSKLDIMNNIFLGEKGNLGDREPWMGNPMVKAHGDREV